MERRGRGQRGGESDETAGGDRSGQPHPGQPGAAGARTHQAGVGDDVGTADVDGAAQALVVQRLADRAEHVGDRDRLDAVVHPQRDRLDDEEGRDLADDLERRRPGADDDAGPEGCGVGGRAEQDALDLEPAGDVGGQLALGRVGHEAGEVDEASYAVLLDGGRDGLGAEAVAVGEVAALQRVDEVDDRVDAVHRAGDRVRVGHVAADRLDPLVPAEAVGVGRRGRRGDDLVAEVEQVRDEAGADVAGGAEDEDAHPIRPRRGA